ncbi:MAG: hypothetical protein HY059_12390 [Proteobacteria bacterium]|nr:hypothetical protein [Pseudomonadota bacterium]
MSASISSAWSSSASSQTNPFRQRMADFQALGKALDSGDLDAAKAAFASLQANAPKAPPADGAQAPGSDKLKTDFDTLAKALESGNLDDAKQAFAQLQDDMKASRGHGHHHRKPPADATDSTAATTASLQASVSTTTTGISITA